MKNITYLLGAGASANAIPIVKYMRDDIKQVLEELEKEEYYLPDELFQFRTSNGGTKNSKNNQRLYQQSFIEGLKWILAESEKYQTIDELAKKLYDNDEKLALEKLKIILSIYLVIRQTINEADRRYYDFFNKIIEKHSTSTDHPILRKNIKIISWNYDFQFEKVYSDEKYYGKGELYNLWYELGVFAKHLPNEGALHNKFSIYKLNGSGGILGTHPLNREGKHYIGNSNLGFNKERLEEIIRSYATCEDEKSDFYSTLSFAFEEDLNSTRSVINRAIEAIKNTNILIVIGYSFPNYNKEIDTQIINSMDNLEKIYIQAPDADILKQKFLKIGSNLKNIQIEEKRNINNFFFYD